MNEPLIRSPLTTEMTGIKIILGSTFLACVLGLALDLVTAHVAVEYFSVHHPFVVESTEPLMMAWIWGIRASWWCGAILGGILAVWNWWCTPSLSAGAVLKLVAQACAALWLIFMSILVLAYLLQPILPLQGLRPPFDTDRRLFAVAATHSTEYLLAFVAMLVVGWRVRRMSKELA